VSRLTTWLKRELPSASARFVEVRDGDDCIARFAVGRGDECEALADDVSEAAASVESRTLYVVAVGKDGTDGASMTYSKGSGRRAERSASGLVATLLRDNEILRSKLVEQTDQVLRAVLAENKRLAESNSALEERRLETFRLMESLTSMQAERDLGLRDMEIRDKRAQSALTTLKDEWGPKLLDFLAGKAETRAAVALGRLVRSASVHAGDELVAMVAKLPAEDASALEDMMKEATVIEARQRAEKEAAARAAKKVVVDAAPANGRKTAS